MADLNYLPIQDNYRTFLSQKVSAAETTSINVRTAITATIPVGLKVALTLNPGTSIEEVIVCDGVSGRVFDIATSGRAQDLGNGKSGTAYDHPVGSEVIISDPYILWNDIKTSLASKVDGTGDTMTGALQFSGTTHAGIRPIGLTTAQRTALALSGSNTAIVYDTDLGDYYVFRGGAWAVLDIGTPTANATTAIAGSVEIPTSGESISGAVTGGTLATLASTPAQVAFRIQNQEHTYIAAGGTVDVITLTLVPAVTAYQAGQVFRFKASGNCTGGGVTVNVNGLGAKTIKTPDGQALKAKSIRTSQLCTIQYDGTDFILMSVTNPKATKGDEVVASGDGADAILGVGANDTLRVADSTQTTGQKWSDVRCKKLSLNTTGVTVTGTTSETTLYQVSIPANTLGTNSMVRATLNISDIDMASDTYSLTLRAKYGGTTLCTAGLQPVVAGTISNAEGWVTFELMGNGATNLQKGVLKGQFFEESGILNATYESAMLFNSGTAAEDSTGALNLTITTQNSNNNVNLVVHSMYIELIQA